MKELVEESENDCCRGGRAGGVVGCAPRGRSVGGDGDRLVEGDKLGVGGGGPGAILTLPSQLLIGCLSLSLSFLFCFASLSSTHA